MKLQHMLKLIQKKKIKKEKILHDCNPQLMLERQSKELTEHKHIENGRLLFSSFFEETICCGLASCDAKLCAVFNITVQALKSVTI